jgi:PAS domain-containing protein
MTASPRHTLPYDQPDRSADLDAAYLTIVEATAPYTGDELLHEVAATIARTLDVSIAFIVEIINDVSHARSLVVFCDGEFRHQEEFALANSPGEQVLRHGRSAHSAGLQEAFPANRRLKDDRAVAQAGVLVYSRSGDPIGMLGIVHDAPLPQVDAYADLLERLAPRVGAELERRQRDIALRRSEARFRLLIEHSSVIMFYYRLQPDERFEYISPAVTKMVGWPPEAFFADAQLAIEVLDPEYRPLVLKAITTGSEEPIVARTTFANDKAAWV